MNAKSAIEVIARWHSHEGINELMNIELAKLSWGAHYAALAYGTTATAANCIKVMLETAFQLGRRHPLSTFEWKLLESPENRDQNLPR